jgi:hypothetical protein
MNKLFIKPCVLYDCGINEYGKLMGKICEGFIRDGGALIIRNVAPYRKEMGINYWWVFNSNVIPLNDKLYAKLKSIGIEEIDRNTNL